MPPTLTSSSAHSSRVEMRQAFDNFLSRRPSKALKKSIPELLADFTEEMGLRQPPLSSSSAYRVAFRRGVRGFRRNTNSKYAEFWETLNWNLPDSDLAIIWNIERGNIQCKRKTLMNLFEKGISEFMISRPLWRKPRDEDKEQYKLAIKVEQLKARQFRMHNPVRNRPR